MVMAGLVPATPIIWHGCAQMIRVAGPSPAMTSLDDEPCYLIRAVFGRGAGFGFSTVFAPSGSKPM
jgi:hypothetical protein